ncbi:N-acetylmannosaminyltransferase [Paenibacillus sp. Root52]|uniref:WecB/TagA/CpsF family glycosyltransferase n=1 Tax=Paenibacillus sp. Root52 TaxID=1736552 RepID=UPI0006F599AE|nr:WecB/TagA/CpsF family glycosyltransferase [Paenibacillus sp. Root52]KQY92076.1 N-acetylmannosaminyltransferase [Paenibacillus sp. Root52]
MSQTGTIPTVSIYGIPFSKLPMSETVEVLREAVLSKQPHHVITANPIMVMAAMEDSAIMRVMQSAEMIVPDGTGVVWAANYCGDPVAERVPGYELLHELLRVGENYRWGVYLLGSTPEVIQETAVRLQQQYPAIRIVGYRDGFFGSDEDDQVVAAIRETAPDLLFVARGADTQEPWINKFKDALQIPVMMGVGGSFDVISGKTKRAPKLFQKLRLEWFYRLLREPSRAGRMLALPKFALKVITDKENVTKAQ